MNFKRKIQEIVGSTYRHALFYNFPGGLRFALSKGGSSLDLALSALRKVTVVCDDIFVGEEHILVHLETFAPTSRFGLRAMLRELKVAGVEVPRVRDVWLDAGEQMDGSHEESDSILCCAFDVPTAKLQNLIWCAITTDLGALRPRPGCRVYLLNPNKGIVVHPYDDRGMDVISRNSPTLSGLYKRHNDLLLDYDREAMCKTFASS
ncbi:DUF3885 domain-containing protein [Actimicrobium antarcticum]|uniref:DUF3885 domain-containing protein n=1 Tax=Actimicrobium antarcticum TaxID=1051899 RepID=A0ABP7SX90_9BURK